MFFMFTISFSAVNINFEVNLRFLTSLAFPYLARSVTIFFGTLIDKRTTLERNVTTADNLFNMAHLIGCS
jgi:hypothetical protein